MQFQLLGQLAVRAERGNVELGSPKQRSVLAVLLLHANEVVPTDRIIDLVWGDNPPRTADHSVQIYISELRKALANGPASDVIDTRPPGYVINVPPQTIDTLRFERLVREGMSTFRVGDIARGRPKLEQALDLWTGEPLADFAYDDFAQGYIRSLTELRSDALEALAALALDEGDLETARGMARHAIDADRLREDPHRVMMLALYRAGRQAEALRHYSAYVEHLADELGIEPSESMRQLEERILLQDPTLDIQRPTHAEGNPYRGLRAFSEDDADVYFGRESLVEEVLERLSNGPGFVSIVGPSGSGKSSAVRAGVTPELRSRGVTVVTFQPGSRPLWELASALDQAGFGGRASLLRRFESNVDVMNQLVTRPLVMVIDQFEELFTLAEPDVAVRFSELISFAIRDHSTPMRVVATLRADYYDKPLSMPALAGVFSDSVVSVKPMTAQEIERAVVEPARAAGVSVEPALLAQLVSDMGDEPGALPLLQFALFELFEQSQDGLTLDDYLSLGGIHGALTGGADQLLSELDEEGQVLAEQLMMRMIQKGRALSTSKPVPLRDLVDLGIDSVELQSVLEAFGSRRLITFDRDASGDAVVEMAHEYLISEWPQMQRWLEKHSADLDVLYALDAATDEWVGADHSEDYLVRGGRLQRFVEWRESTTLRLTKTESAFIAASEQLRRRDEEAAAEQAEIEESLRRSARRRLWAFGVAIAALAAAVTVLVLTVLPEPPPDILIVYDAEAGEGGGFSGLISLGLNDAAEEHGLNFLELSDSNPAHVPIALELIEDGVGLVLLQRAPLHHYEELHRAVESNPETQFVWLDCDPHELEGMGSNETCVVSLERELAFLAGLVAARTTSTGIVGIVVGVNGEFMYPFHEGFQLGVQHVDPTVRVAPVYLSYDGDDGFNSWTLGQLAARNLISEGADVIFLAAGHSGYAVADEVRHHAIDTGEDIWVIGVDDDMHTALEQSGEEYLLGIREIVLTSIVKRIDLGVAQAIDQYATKGTVEPVFLGIDGEGVDYVETGGYLTGLVPYLEDVKQRVNEGDLEVEGNPDIEVRMLVDLIEPGISP